MKNIEHRPNFIEIRFSDCQITLNWTLSELDLILEMQHMEGLFKLPFLPNLPQTHSAENLHCLNCLPLLGSETV